tara:strand:- start:1887 stop:2099 length:213 start_codon:yes stop_codon:yes gene_type:complete
MTQLIKPTDPRYFTVSSTDLYDRHHYKVVSQNGESITVDNWEDVRTIWWNKKAFLSHVEVLDAQKPKGFK